MDKLQELHRMLKEHEEAIEQIKEEYRLKRERQGHINWVNKEEEKHKKDRKSKKPVKKVKRCRCKK